jgi:localization factor PodJL
VIAINPPPAAYQMPAAIPSLFGPPVFEPKVDITGSIPRPAATSQPARPPAPAAPATPASADRLPAAIGGSKLRNAAIAGDAAAAYAVALRFAEGRGVPVNLEEAAHWYERAASKGLVPAQFRYASLWEKGLGVKKDLAQARRLYLAAASKGNSKAMHNLAVLYAEGIDGKIDYGTAVQWFRKAAQHGIADSQYNLGVLCARGLGTDKNYAEAYKWFALAAAQGDSEAAKKRDDVASQLDAAALAAAEQAVKSFVAEQQPQDAVAVREPPGGWDHAAGAPAQASPRTGPLALGALQTGKR